MPTDAFDCLGQQPPRRERRLAAQRARPLVAHAVGADQHVPLCFSIEAPLRERHRGEAPLRRAVAGGDPPRGEAPLRRAVVGVAPHAGEGLRVRRGELPRGVKDPRAMGAPPRPRGVADPPRGVLPPLLVAALGGGVKADAVALSGIDKESCEGSNNGLAEGIATDFSFAIGLPSATLNSPSACEMNGVFGAQGSA